MDKPAVTIEFHDNSNPTKCFFRVLFMVNENVVGDSTKDFHVDGPTVGDVRLAQAKAFGYAMKMFG